MFSRVRFGKYTNKLQKLTAHVMMAQITLFVTRGTIKQVMAID